MYDMRFMCVCVHLLTIALTIYRIHKLHYLIKIITPTNVTLPTVCNSFDDSLTQLLTRCQTYTVYVVPNKCEMFSCVSYFNWKKRNDVSQHTFY